MIIIMIKKSVRITSTFMKTSKYQVGNFRDENETIDKICKYKWLPVRNLKLINVKLVCC